MPLSGLTDMKVHSYIVSPRGEADALHTSENLFLFNKFSFFKRSFLPDWKIFSHAYLCHHIILKVFQKKYIFSQRRLNLHHVNTVLPDYVFLSKE